MFESSRRNISLIGTGAALTLFLAGGTAAGVVPKIGNTANTASSAPAVTTPGGLAPATVAEMPAAETPPPTVTPTSAAPVTAPPTTKAPAGARRAAPANAAPAANAAPTAPASPAVAEAPKIAARLNPTTAQISGAIGQLASFLPITPSEAQARQFGDQVCDAFDQGQAFAQVKAAARQAASQIPFVTVTAGAIDQAVRTAVGLFCPGYSSKLV